DAAGLVAVVFGDAAGADADAARAEIVENGAADGDVLATVAEPDAVAAVVADFAILDDDVAGAVGHDVGFDGGGGLDSGDSGGGHVPLGIFEDKAAEGDVLDELFLGGVSFYGKKSGGDGSDDFGGFGIFAGEREISEGAV